jgi:hypothetical protein
MRFSVPEWEGTGTCGASAGAQSGEGWRVGGDVDLGSKIKGKKKIIITGRWVPQKVYKQTQNRYDQAPLCHASTDSGPHRSEIMLSQLKTRISAHWNEFAQNRWFLCNFAE